MPTPFHSPMLALLLLVATRSKQRDWPHSVGARAMATSSGDAIPTQLAALLGKKTVHVRKTKERPPRAPIYDVIDAVG